MKEEQRLGAGASRWTWLPAMCLFLSPGGIATSAEPSKPIITTVAGGGSPTGNGDSGPATNARLSKPVDVAVDAVGNLYIADVAEFVGQDGYKVRRVDGAGIITTVAGNGSTTYNGDGIPATSAGISVKGIAVDAAGNLFIADAHNQRIRKVAPSGLITTVAGNGVSGFSGDGGQARNAKLNFPSDVAVDAAGNLFILDSYNYRVRRVGVDGVIRTVAGNGQYGFGGDGGAATAAMFAEPHGIAIDAAGNLFIADYGNDRVRKVTPAGKISTVAGGGPFRSDPIATKMKLLGPHGVAADARGNIYIAERNNLVRVVNASGIIKAGVGPFNDTTFGNEGAPWGFAGDGGPADQALIYEPLNLALDAKENLYIADSRNGRVRKVTTIPTPETAEGLDAFEPYKSTLVGSYTQHVAVADVTGDGRDDALLTTTTWSGPYVEPANDFKLLVFIQKPDGTLAAPIKYGYAGDPVGGRSGSGLATGDLDKDGFKDVVIGTLNGVTIYRGNPSGLFNGVVSAGVANAQTVSTVALIDVDRDGKLDIVTLGGGSSAGGTSPTDKYGMTVHYGDGKGGVVRKVFAATTELDAGGGPMVGTNLRVVDVNRDGVPDLVKTWSGYQTGGVDVLLHNRVDGFQAPTRLGPSALGSWLSAAYAVGDFNSDGTRDVMLSRYGNAPQAAYIHIRQDVPGTFSEVREWPAYDSPEDMVSADMNGDGRDDLLVVHGGWSSVGYHQQSWKGLDVEFKYYIPHSGNPRIPSIAVGDLNGDACRDVAVADYNYGLIVLNGKNCVRAQNGSKPLLPPRPVAPTSGALVTTAVPSASPAPGTLGAATRRMYVSLRRVLNDVWRPRPGYASRHQKAVAMGGALALLAVLGWLALALKAAWSPGRRR